jgi:hypothetical protein
MASLFDYIPILFGSGQSVCIQIFALIESQRFNVLACLSIIEVEVASFFKMFFSQACNMI